MAWTTERCTECGGVLEVDGPRAKCLSCGMEFFDPGRVPEPGFQDWLGQGAEYSVIVSGSVVPKFIMFREFGETQDIRVQV